jgi:hypothetical protein
VLNSNPNKRKLPPEFLKGLSKPRKKPSPPQSLVGTPEHHRAFKRPRSAGTGTEIVRGRSDGHLEMKKKFPVGYEVLKPYSDPDTAKGLHMMWEAVYRSLEAQHPKVPKPAEDKLIDIWEKAKNDNSWAEHFEETGSRGRPQLTSTTRRRRSKHEDLMAHVLWLWGREVGINLELGIIDTTQGTWPLVHPLPLGCQGKIKTVWILVDGQSQAQHATESVKGNEAVSPRFWRALAPKKRR